jgi:hypothetical protein
MKKFLSGNREWSEITDIVYSICEKNGIEFRTNISGYCMWVRPENHAKDIYEQIRNRLIDYEEKKLVEIKESTEDLGISSDIIEVIRK